MNTETERLLRRVLHRIAEEAVPAGTDLWPGIRARLVTRSAHRLPARAAVLAATLTAVLVAVAYAGNPVVDALFKLVSGWEQAWRSGLAVPLGLEQSRDGWTVRLERAYADVNQVLVAFSVRGPAGVQLSVSPRAWLLDGAGRQIPGRVLIGVAGASDVLGLHVPPGEGVFIVSFDTWQMSRPAAEVALGLEIRLETLVPVENQDRPAEVPGRALAQRAVTQDLAGVFKFEFRLPVNPGKVLAEGVLASAGGIRATLKYLVLSPSQLKAEICFSGLAAEKWLPVALVVGPNGAVSDLSLVTAEGPGCFRYELNVGPNTLSAGRWQLKIAELVEKEPAESGRRLTGPWAFEFAVP
jgi:hypothetical protein